MGFAGPSDVHAERPDQPLGSRAGAPQAPGAPVHATGGAPRPTCRRRRPRPSRPLSGAARTRPTRSAPHHKATVVRSSNGLLCSDGTYHRVPEHASGHQRGHREAVSRLVFVSDSAGTPAARRASSSPGSPPARRAPSDPRSVAPNRSSHSSQPRRAWTASSISAGPRCRAKLASASGRLSLAGCGALKADDIDSTMPKGRPRRPSR